MADFASVGELESFMGSGALGARGTNMLGYASALIRAHLSQDVDEAHGRQEQQDASNQAILTLTQVPVTSVSEILIDGVAFTEFAWSRWGSVHKSDWSAWDEGPIRVTYDSGYPDTSDEFQAIKAVCLKVAARALGGPQDGAFASFGNEVAELRGAAPSIFLTEQEMNTLDQFGRVAAVG